MELDPTVVKRVARLARIRIEEQHVPQIQQQLTGILNWIEQLGEVNTDQVEPMSSVHAKAMPVREDVVNDGNCAEAILTNAPERELDLFAVPKVVE
ncbi:MAG: Asp-tRNA(Asn)/Glu-tRNA(Gln) amidotransferase subunit GatC [Holosporales bacterium]